MVDNAPSLSAGDDHQLTVFQVPTGAAGEECVTAGRLYHEPQLQFFASFDCGDFERNRSICLENAVSLAEIQHNGLESRNHDDYYS